jgi:hypothetical protein
MKYLLISFLLMVCSTAVSRNEPTFTVVQLGQIDTPFEHNMRISKLFIDDCMYICIRGYHEMSITHAGNCPNPIHHEQLSRNLGN